MNNFYLGRIFDPAQGKTLDQPLNYDPEDLTTHAVVTGMTGSGKTGLCIGLLEEAALNGIPAIVIDPKGDLTNLVLHFPNLAPADFQPWIDADAARRQGKSLEAAAQETAVTWKDGLAAWGIAPERLQALQQAVDFVIYTPGSDAGKPISILASLKAPALPWEGNRELLREEISTTITALLTLIGLQNIDPMRSREHILLSNIVENAWSQGKDLDLPMLITQTQAPPFTKLGVFPVETFFPEKDRFDLALLLNNFLAAPSFETWLEGQALDIPTLLYTPDQHPRHNIFYLAHLNDAERMFFVTLLFSAIETWMRAQSGSTGLRALVYFDEIAGYLPPVNNPPSKAIILRMLKQARAFGVGLLLASQNPVDVDYKALSNAGTWMIGKVQTDQDKQRLLDGLLSADGSLDRASFDRLIASLGKRGFLLHNVHQPGPVLFQTRWTMNYLAGPLTRAQIPALNQLASMNSHTGTAARMNSHTGTAASVASHPATSTEAESHPAAAAPTRASLPPAAAAPTRASLSPAAAAPTRANLPPTGAAPTPASLPPADAAPTPANLPPADAAPTLANLSPTDAAPTLANLPPTDAAPTQASLPPADAAPTTAAAPAKTAMPTHPMAASAHPALPSEVAEYYMPNTVALAEALQANGRTLPADTPPAAYLYRPALLAQARIRYLARKYNFDHEQTRTVLVHSLDRRGVVRWDDFTTHTLEAKTVQLNGLLQAVYAGIEAPLDDAKVMTALQKDFTDWAYRTSQVKLRYNAALNVSAAPEMSTGQFHDACSQAARAGSDDELAKINANFDAKKAALQDKLAAAQRMLQEKENTHKQRQVEEVGTGFENVVGLLTGSRRRVSSSLTKRRLTENAKAAVDDAQAAASNLQKQIAELDQARQQALAQANQRWGQVVDNVTEIPLTPLRKDVFVDLFGVIWLPFYVLQAGGESFELPAYD